MSIKRAMHPIQWTKRWGEVIAFVFGSGGDYEPKEGGTVDVNDEAKWRIAVRLKFHDSVTTQC
jgi:hypothetical protein